MGRYQLFSLQTVAVDSYQSSAGTSTLKAHVIEGGNEGAVLVSDKIVNKFSATPFDSSFPAAAGTRVGVGQKGSDGQYGVELEFPVDARVAVPVRTEVTAAVATGKKVSPK